METRDITAPTKERRKKRRTKRRSRRANLSAGTSKKEGKEIGDFTIFEGIHNFGSRWDSGLSSPLFIFIFECLDILLEVGLRFCSSTFWLAKGSDLHVVV